MAKTEQDIMVQNIRDYYVSASEDQCEQGRAWYPAAYKLVSTIADYTGLNTERITFALAALSPRNPWRWNVFDAYSFAAARAEGRTMPRATTFKRNWAAAWAALDYGTDPWSTSAPKVRAFVEAINGNSEAVVVDTWAVRIATGGKRDRVKSDADYATIAGAYVRVAETFGEEPRAVQAITWLVAQTEGLASQRRGRHDLAFKAGTPSWLQAAVAQEPIA